MGGQSPVYAHGEEDPRSRLESYVSKGREYTYGQLDSPMSASGSQSWSASPPPMDHLSPYDGQAHVHASPGASQLVSIARPQAGSYSPPALSPNSINQDASTSTAAITRGLYTGLQTDIAPQRQQPQPQQQDEEFLAFTPTVPSQPEEPHAHTHPGGDRHHHHGQAHGGPGPSRSNRDASPSSSRRRRSAHSDPPKPTMACLFCRGRKVCFVVFSLTSDRILMNSFDQIACGPPPPGSTDRSCE